jgi:hypothetical protein
MSHEGSGPTAQEPLDRKAMLLEQFNEVEAAPAAVADKSPEPQQQAAPASRARDEAGKFIPKDKASAIEAAPQVDAAPAAPDPWAKAPDSWKKELRENWGKMDPAYQRYVHEREQQMKAGVEPLLPKAELADKITQAAEPYMNTIRGLGLELPQAVAGLMKVDHDLRTLPYDQKLAVLNHVALGYGIDLSGQMQNARQAYDPGVQAMQNELLAIKGQFSSFTQQQEAAQNRAAQDEIQRFAKTAEHFDEAKPVMVQLLQSGMADGIEDAYDKAIRLSPDLFDKIQSAKQATADAEKRKTADEAAKRAKAAAVSVRSATPGTKTTTNAQDRRSMLREQLDGLSERL